MLPFHTWHICTDISQSRPTSVGTCWSWNRQEKVRVNYVAITQCKAQYFDACITQYCNNTVPENVWHNSTLTLKLMTQGDVPHTNNTQHKHIIIIHMHTHTNIIILQSWKVPKQANETHNLIQLGTRIYILYSSNNRTHQRQQFNTFSTGNLFTATIKYCNLFVLSFNLGD